MAKLFHSPVSFRLGDCSVTGDESSWISSLYCQTVIMRVCQFASSTSTFPVPFILNFMNVKDEKCASLYFHFPLCSSPASPVNHTNDWPDATATSKKCWWLMPWVGSRVESLWKYLHANELGLFLSDMMSSTQLLPAMSGANLTIIIFEGIFIHEMHLSPLRRSWEQNKIIHTWNW